MQLFSIWLTPVKQDEDYLREIINDLGQKYSAPDFAPHLTVYGGVNCESDYIINVAKDTIKGIKPFKITVDRLNFSELFFKTVFIEFLENESLRTINMRLNEKLKKLSEYTFKPHISLIYKLMEDDKKKAIIDSLKIKREFTVGTLVIITPSKGDDFLDIAGWKAFYSQDLVG